MTMDDLDGGGCRRELVSSMVSWPAAWLAGHMAKQQKQVYCSLGKAERKQE